MPNEKKPKPGSKDYGTVKFRGFIKVALKDHEKKQIKANLLGEADAMGFIHELTGNGYKFSLSLSNDGKFYTATAYCNDFRKANAGYGLSMRHADYLVAITCLQWCFALEGYDTDWAEVWGVADDDNW